MKNFINTLVIVALVLGFSFSVTGPLWANENDAVTAATQKLAEAKTAMAKKAAEEKAAAGAIESVRRSQRSYSEFAMENAKSALQVGKAAVCATGSVIATADGYAGYVVAYPAVYVTTKAFEGGNSAWSAAGSAWNAPVANVK